MFGSFTPGRTLVRSRTLCAPCRWLHPGAWALAALAQAPDDGWLRNAGRPRQEHASVDNPLVILLVEDEVLVRMVAADVLEDAGFTVLESTNAEEALRLLETRPDVQVLFTDVNMPGALDGLGSWSCADRARTITRGRHPDRVRPRPAQPRRAAAGHPVHREAVCPRCPHRRRTCRGTRTAGEGRTLHDQRLTEIAEADHNGIADANGSRRSSNGFPSRAVWTWTASAIIDPFLIEEPSRIASRRS